MSRQARVLSISGTYHIIQRGIDQNVIFLQDNDYRKYLSILEKYLKNDGCQLYAYCLMDNHVHLLIHFSQDAPGHLMHKLSISYSLYFNKKYERCGHLFQNRFKSEPVEDDEYFLTLVRYIHKNPEKAGICKAAYYKWSSYGSYMGEEGIVYTRLLLDMIGGEENYSSFMNDSDVPEILKSDSKRMTESDPKRMTDHEAIKIIQSLTGRPEMFYLKSLCKEIRDPLIIKIKNSGVTSRQIARITGISKSTVQRIR